MSTAAAACESGPDLDGQTVWALVSALTDLAAFFDDCHRPVADTVNDHFDDLAAADWVPIVPADYAQALTATLSAAREEPTRDPQRDDRSLGRTTA